MLIPSGEKVILQSDARWNQFDDSKGGKDAPIKSGTFYLTDKRIIFEEHTGSFFAKTTNINADLNLRSLKNITKGGFSIASYVILQTAGYNFKIYIKNPDQVVETIKTAFQSAT